MLVPGGRLLFLEHGHAGRGWLARRQDRWPGLLLGIAGCNWNRQPAELIRRSGLKLVSQRRSFFGMLYELEAEAGGAVGHRSSIA